MMCDDDGLVMTRDVEVLSMCCPQRLSPQLLMMTSSPLHSIGTYHPAAACHHPAASCSSDASWFGQCSMDNRRCHRFLCRRYGYGTTIMYCANCSLLRFRPFLMRRASALAVEGIFFMTLQIFWAAIAQNRGRVLGNVKTQWLIPEAYPVIGVIAAGV